MEPEVRDWEPRHALVGGGGHGGRGAGLARRAGRPVRARARGRCGRCRAGGDASPRTAVRAGDDEPRPRTRSSASSRRPARELGRRDPCGAVGGGARRPPTDTVYALACRPDREVLRARALRHQATLAGSAHRARRSEVAALVELIPELPARGLVAGPSPSSCRTRSGDCRGSSVRGRTRSAFVLPARDLAGCRGVDAYRRHRGDECEPPRSGGSLSPLRCVSRRSSTVSPPFSTEASFPASRRPCSISRGPSPASSAEGARACGGGSCSGRGVAPVGWRPPL